MTIYAIASNHLAPPQVPEDGLLYSVPSAKTDIRRTFREKYGWVGPEEKRRFAEALHQAASTELRSVK